MFKSYFLLTKNKNKNILPKNTQQLTNKIFLNL